MNEHKVPYLHAMDLGKVIDMATRTETIRQELHLAESDLHLAVKSMAGGKPVDIHLNALRSLTKAFLRVDRSRNRE